MKFKGVIDFIEKNDYFIITAHETPDGDAIGSEYAMLKILQQMKKKVRIINADQTPNNFRFVDVSDEVETLDNPDDLPDNLDDYVLLILDANEIGNIGDVSKYILPRVKDHFIIDHHESGDDILSSNLIEQTASSTGEIIYQLAEQLPVEIDIDIANALYMAIVYDTGSFIYPKTSALTLRIAHELLLTGVQPNDIYSQIYETKSIASLKLQSIVLASLELTYEDHVAIQIMLKESLIESGASYEEGHGLINIPLGSKAVYVSIFFKENLEGIMRCSLRSKGNIDVALIAQKYSGGGHKTAAGFKCSESLETVRANLLQDLKPYFSPEDK